MAKQTRIFTPNDAKNYIRYTNKFACFEVYLERLIGNGNALTN